MMKRISKKDEDIDIVESDEDGTEATQVKKLKEKLKKCLDERKEYLDGWQRMKADSINLRREEEKRREEFAKFAKEDLLHELLPVADSFEMAFRDKKTWGRLPENWRKGVEYIYAQLMDTFKRNGLESIDPSGQPFDPNIHTSVGTVESDDKKQNGIVLEVTQKGYTLHGKVIRLSARINRL